MKKIALILGLMLVGVSARATVVSQNISATFTCTGTTGPFAFTFSVSAANAITVNQNGTVLSQTAYVVTPVNNNYGNGGSITLNAACPNAQTLTITRTTPLTQSTVFADNMPVPMKSFENGLDKLTEIAQELGATKGGTGSVNSVAVANANGFQGTVLNPNTNPTISISVDSTHVLPTNTGNGSTFLNSAGTYSTLSGSGLPSGSQYQIQTNGGSSTFGHSNAYTDATGNPLTVPGALIAQLAQGVGNTDTYASGGGNNGIANFFAANPTGLGAVPPTSTDTEAADTTVGSGARLFDQRANGYILTTKNVGQSHNCAPFVFGPATDTICRRDTFTTPAGNHNHVIDYLIDYSPGYSLGSSGTSATGWSGGRGHLLQYDGFSRGIKNGHETVMNCYSIGDCNGDFVYLYADGGATASADQGDGAAYFQAEEATSYFHGTVVTGGTGASSLTTAFTSGQNGFTDGGYLLDIPKGTLSGTVSDISYPTINGTGFMAWDLTGITMPVSTAWGTSTSATTSAANGKFQIPVSQTITFTVPAGSGAYVVGNNACIVQGFAEQVAITAVGNLSGGSQSVTFTTRYGYNSGALLMQGGMCGQFGTKTGATWRTAVMAIGSLSSTQVLLAACTGGVCTASARNKASDLVVQVIGGNGTNVSFYPGAEIIGTNGGTPNSVQLGTNTVAWANGDAIEGPHPAAVNLSGLGIVAAQTTPENDGFTLPFYVNWLGPTTISQMSQWNAQAPVLDMLTFSGTYNWGIVANSPVNGIIQCNCSTGYLFQENGGNYAGLGFTDATGFYFNGYGGTAPVLARNIPGVPTALGQIPIATSLNISNANYQPVTVSGDGTLSSAGVLTVTKSSGNPIVTGSGTTGYLPLLTNTSAIGNSHCDDGVTVAGTITCTEPISINVSYPSYASYRAGTGNIPALTANSAGFAAPVTGGTSWLGKLPATITAGLLHFAAPATGDGVNESAITSAPVNLASADVTGVLPTANGGAGITQGTATLVSGTITVSTSAAVAVSGGHYLLTNCGASGTAIGTPSVGTVTAGTSFVINSMTATNTVATGDTSTVCWWIR